MHRTRIGVSLAVSRPHMPKGLYAQTALADLDNDGRLEYIVGQQYGAIF